jgi:hypothetical protein
VTRISHRPGLVAAALLSIALVAVPVRVALQSRAELAAAVVSESAGDHARAIDHFRRALRWSLPIFNHQDEAIAGLERIARTREVEGDRAGALLAWRSIVGGLSSARSLYVPPSRDLKRAKNEITRLAVPEDEAGRYRALLDREVSPNPLGATFLLFGFFVWLGSLALLIGKGFDGMGRLQLDSARAPLFGALAGFASFVIGLVFA